MAKTLEQAIDKHYKDLFDEVIFIVGDGFHEILIEVSVKNSGKTIRRSWRDRDKMFKEEEDGQVSKS